jgi:flagellar L-ring protein precursor FlgH
MTTSADRSRPLIGRRSAGRSRPAAAGCLVAALALGPHGQASAQSLFQAPLPPAPSPTTEPNPAPNSEPSPASDSGAAPSGQPSPQPQPAQPTPAPGPARAPLSLDQVGLFVVKPVRPRQHVKHDKIQIIINEVSTQKLEQNLDTKEDYNLRAELRQFPSLRALLRDGEFKDGIGTNTPNVGGSGSSDYKGKGTAERKDRLTAQVSGLIADVKPNGLLLVEARETIINDNETKSLVLSGLCDPKDITTSNTVESSQLANLVIRIEHSGDVKDAATKNWFTRVLDGLFGP